MSLLIAMHHLLVYCLVFLTTVLWTVQALPTSAYRLNTAAAIQDDAHIMVRLDHFAQLVATHWHFEHVESLLNRCNDVIAQEMENHIKITAADPERDGFAQKSHLIELPVLRSQIFNAIQAHTEEWLPTMWASLNHRLGRQALEGVVRQQIQVRCTGAEATDDEAKLLPFDCFRTHAQSLVVDLDDHVRSHLTKGLDTLNSDMMPAMLSNLTRSLHATVEYFNQVAPDHTTLHLRTLPWQSTFLTDRQAALLDQRMPEDDHSSDLMLTFAKMAQQD